MNATELMTHMLNNRWELCDLCTLATLKQHGKEVNDAALELAISLHKLNIPVCDMCYFLDTDKRARQFSKQVKQARAEWVETRGY